jgi:hypothetical protein
MIYYTVTINQARGIGDAPWSLYPPETINQRAEYRAECRITDKDDPLTVDNWRCANVCIARWNKEGRGSYSYQLLL